MAAVLICLYNCNLESSGWQQLAVQQHHSLRSSEPSLTKSRLNFDACLFMVLRYGCLEWSKRTQKDLFLNNISYICDTKIKRLYIAYYIN